MKFKFLALAVILSLVGCTSSTLIQSEPSGANVFLDDNYVGQTPVKVKDSKISFSRTYVRIEKEGYEPVETYITKDHSINVVAAIGGVILWFPFLWVMEYPPVHTYLLKPSQKQNDQLLNELNNQNIQSSKYQQLIDLKKLLDQGIITQEEFDKEKQKILQD